MPHEPLVNYSVADGLATVELNRPARRNAIIPPMLDALAEAIDAASGDESVQAVLLCGSGGAFCSGLDLDAHNADPPPPWMATGGDSAQTAHSALGRCAVPIVVALERYAINGGAAYALAGDLIVVGESAWLQVGEMIQGLPAPMNLAWLTAKYPESVTARVVYSGERIRGPELHAMGIAHCVVADDAVLTHATELAQRIAASPNGTPRPIKAAIRTLYGRDPLDQIERARVAIPITRTFRPTRAPDV
jgi:enoyl-CoA hydratase/carnithine racemase